MHIMHHLKSFNWAIALVAFAMLALAQAPIAAHAAGSITQINSAAGSSCQACHMYKDEGKGLVMVLSSIGPINEGLIDIGGGSGGHKSSETIVDLNHHSVTVHSALSHGEQARLMKHIRHSTYVSHVKALLMHTKRRHLRRLV